MEKRKICQNPQKTTFWQKAVAGDRADRTFSTFCSLFKHRLIHNAKSGIKPYKSRLRTTSPHFQQALINTIIINILCIYIHLFLISRARENPNFTDTFLSVNFTHWTHIWHKYLTHFGGFLSVFFCFFVILYTAFWIFKKIKFFLKSWRVMACYGVLWRVFLCYNRATSRKEGLTAREIQQKGVVKLIYWVREQPRARRGSL